PSGVGATGVGHVLGAGVVGRRLRHRLGPGLGARLDRLRDPGRAHEVDLVAVEGGVAARVAAGEAAVVPAVVAVPAAAVGGAVADDDLVVAAIDAQRPAAAADEGQVLAGVGDA